ncbi:MAG TPA: allophanate hydrolase subunit 1 [Fimbriimonadaceae bacterium]|nr:allophanate hydrolase subunit 1 [Fimbriimonadaceae bacterium]
MKVERLGERAVILRDLPCQAYRIADSLNSNQGLFQGFQEAVPSYETVGIYFENRLQSIRDLNEMIENAVNSIWPETSPQYHDIPVCYELGEDLLDSADALGVSPEQLVEAHVSQEYTCYAVGFCPGFGYLGYLDESISGLPRRPSPRIRVEPGSVGITGRQTAIYPSATPGGWNLIGRCPLQLVDVPQNYFPIRAGDRIRFYRVDESEFGRLRGERL